MSTPTIHADAVLEIVADVARIVERAQARIADLGVVGVFIPGFKSHLVVDQLREAQQELGRMATAVKERDRG